MSPAMMNYRTLALTLALLAGPMAAQALDLAAARGRGNVCEVPDGTLRAVSAAADVQALVSEVNARRQEEYARIAAKSGQTPAVAGKLAHAQIVAKGAVACP